MPHAEHKLSVGNAKRQLNELPERACRKSGGREPGKSPHLAHCSFLQVFTSLTFQGTDS